MDARWFRVLSAQAPISRKVRMPVLGVLLYTVAALWFEKHYLRIDLVFPVGMHTLLGAVLGVLLVFRTNTAYDRWWEGRKLWGQLINDLRTLALKIGSLDRLPASERHQLGVCLLGFGTALRDHLRGEASASRLPDGVPAPPEPTAHRAEGGALPPLAPPHRAEGGALPPLAPPHLPVYVSGLIFRQVRDWQRRGLLDGEDVLALNPQLDTLMTVCGGCERIRNTPLNTSHLAYVRQVIMLYLLVLPFGLPFGWWIIPSVTLLGYFLLGVEDIAEDIEEPFGKDPDDLPLDALCAALESSMQELLPAPEKTEPYATPG